MIRKYAILGESLKHTMSPPIHARLFELKGREYEYEIIEYTAAELHDNINRLNLLAGYNITIPHKVEIIKYLDRLDDSAKRYNSVNCVALKDGERVGYNTDCDGFLLTVESMGVPLSGSVLLVGCGGVGRMIAIESALHGADLTIAVLESDLPLAKTVREKILKMKSDAVINIVLSNEIDTDRSYDLLVNACPAGMYPHVDGCAVTEEVVKASKAVFDLVYNPAKTKLIGLAEKNGVKAVGGMAMLVYQAVSAHAIWDGDSYSAAEVREIIDEMNEKVKRDFK